MAYCVGSLNPLARHRLVERHVEGVHARVGRGERVVTRVLPAVLLFVCGEFDRAQCSRSPRLPAALIAWTLMLNDVPAATVDGAFRTCSETAGWASAAVTPMPDSVPVSLDVNPWPRSTGCLDPRAQQ